MKIKKKRLSKKKDLVSQDIYREKKNFYKQKIVVRTHFWDIKNSLGNGERGHSLKIKTKGNQRKRVW